MADSKVIIVSSSEALRKLAAKATYESALEPSPIIKGAIGGLGIIMGSAGNTITSIFSRNFMKNSSDEEVLTHLESILNLGVKLTLFRPEEAMTNLNFGVGQYPIDGSIYICHPIARNTYIAPSEFSRTLAKEKEAAFRQLASALGAKKITLVDARLKNRKSLFKAKTTIKDTASDVGIKAEFSSEGYLVKRVYSTFGKPRREPYIPEELGQWLEIDSDLRTMAKGRIDGRLQSERISLEFKEGLDIGGILSAKLATHGFIASGSFRSLEQSLWYFDVEYWPHN